MIPSAGISVSLPLNEQTAVITGAGSAEGIGFAIARRLYAAGVRVVITSTTDRIHTRARELDAGGYERALNLLNSPLQKPTLASFETNDGLHTVPAFASSISRDQPSNARAALTCWPVMVISSSASSPLVRRRS